MLHACNLHETCSPTCAKHACCMRVACVLHACCMRVACVLHACCMRVTCVLHACYMRVTCMKHAHVHAPCMHVHAPYSPLPAWSVCILAVGI